MLVYLNDLVFLQEAVETIASLAGASFNTPDFISVMEVLVFSGANTAKPYIVVVLFFFSFFWKHFMDGGHNSLQKAPQWSTFPAELFINNKFWWYSKHVLTITLIDYHVKCKTFGVYYKYDKDCTCNAISNPRHARA